MQHVYIDKIEDSEKKISMCGIQRKHISVKRYHYPCRLIFQDQAIKDDSGPPVVVQRETTLDPLFTKTNAPNEKGEFFIEAERTLGIGIGCLCGILGHETDFVIILIQLSENLVPE